MYDYTLHRRRKHYCRYCLQAFSTEEKLKRQSKDKREIKMLKKGEYVKLKNFERKIKSPFMIYADFASVLAGEDNGKQNPEESYTNKYQKHVACSYCCKLACVNDNFSKGFKSYLGEDAIYNLLVIWPKKAITAVK